jgi:hypothetical protein
MPCSEVHRNASRLWCSVDVMIWCYFNNRANDYEGTFAVRALKSEMYCIVGATIPT